MPARRLRAPALACLAVLLLAAAVDARPGPAVEYTLSFPAPQLRWMQVEVLFPDAAGPGPLRVRMSRTSPGRYAPHEFAKNVYDVHAYDTQGREMRLDRPDAHEWDVPASGGAVRFAYKVFGDRVDGTYLGIDTTHAHINAPAVFAWARGLEDLPARVTLRPPPAHPSWRPTTQLFPTSDPLVFTAPNLQYLMDSPIEVGAADARVFRVPAATAGGAATIRVVVHHQGSDAELDAYVAAIERVVRVEQQVFGELPAFEPGAYTFLIDYLPWAEGDGMEHRNSTVITSSAPLRLAAPRLIGTVAHEFFHAWNVERIRPASLEPFDFSEPRPSRELWLAEGFTSYYERLCLARAGLADTLETTAAWSAALNGVVNAPGRRFRPPTEMSLLAPLVDGAPSRDRVNLENTVVSYYTWGSVLALALDLSLRDRSDGRVTLDDFMRALWRGFGKPGGVAPGLVGRPYTLDDLRDTLAAVAGERAFADAFFDRYVAGLDLPDVGPLLARAGFVLRRAMPNRAWLGNLRLAYEDGGARLEMPTPMDTPAWTAGIAQDDLLLSLDGTRLTGPDALAAVLRRHRAGDAVRVVFRRRESDRETTVTAALAEDPTLEIVPVEATGAALTAAQRAFRKAWVGGE